MAHAPKIATCCYCGTRAALVLKGEGRHELACGSCGAPLHDLKLMPSARPSRSQSAKPSVPLSKSAGKPQKIKDKPKRKSKKQKKRGLLYWAKEAFDEIEDLFD